MHTAKVVNHSMLVSVCLAGTLAACSSTPPPTAQLAIGQTSVETAQSAGAAQLAPVEYEMALNKLSRAKMEVKDGHMASAKRLAEQADVDAQVARSKANAERSQKAADEIMAGLKTMRQTAQPGDSSLMPNPPAAGNMSPMLTQPPSGTMTPAPMQPPMGASAPGGPRGGLDKPMPAER